MSPSFSRGLGQARSWPLQGSGGNSGTEGAGQRQASSQMLSLIRGRTVPGRAGKPRWMRSQSSAHPCVDLSRGWGDRTQGTLAGWPLSPFRSPQPPAGPGRRGPRSADVRAQPRTPCLFTRPLQMLAHLVARHRACPSVQLTVGQWTGAAAEAWARTQWRL